MADLLACEFWVFQYVPDAAATNAINIGVLLRTLAPGHEPLVRFTKDWSSVLQVDKDADLELLDSLERDIATQLRSEVSTGGEGGFVDYLLDTLSNSLQITDPKLIHTDHLEAESELLFRHYVDPGSAC